MGAEVLALGLLAFLLTYWLHSTVLLGLAWLVTRRLSTASASLREGIWRVALLGGFITAGVQMGLGVEPPLGRWVLRSVVANEPTSTVETAALETRDFAGTGVMGTSAAPPLLRITEELVPEDARAHVPAVVQRRVPPVAPVVVPALEIHPVDAGHADPIAEPPHDLASEAELAPAPELGLAAGIGTTPTGLPTPVALSRWVAGGWIGAVVLAVLGLGACCLRLRRGLAGKVELTEGPLARTLARLNARAELRPAPRLFVAPRIVVPLCTGLLRPSICIPPRALGELSRAEQEAMLAHELGHLVRRDPLWTCLTWVAQNVFFFQPLNRLARRELLATAELLADDWAATTTGERLSLASCLTRIAGWLVGDRPQLLAPQMTRDSRTGRSHLGVRVERLLDEDEAPLAARRRWLAPSACACLLSLVLGVPGFAAVAAEPIEPSAPPTLLVEHLDRVTEPDAFALPPWRLKSTVDPQLALELTELDREVVSLQEELAQLRAQLDGLDLTPSIQRAVSELERRARNLADRRGRVNSVVWEALPPGIRP